MPDTLSRSGPRNTVSVWYRPVLFIKDAKLCIGSGVLVDPRVLKHEVDTLGVKGRVFVDWRCGIITEDHIARDKGSDHLAKKIGSTGSGCGPANSDRVMRISPQAKDVPELAGISDGCSQSH